MSRNNYSKEDLYNITMVKGTPMTVHFTPKSVSLRDNGAVKTVLKLVLNESEKESITYNISSQNRTYGLVKCIAKMEGGREKEIAFHTNDVQKIELPIERPVAV